MHFLFDGVSQIRFIICGKPFDYLRKWSDQISNGQFYSLQPGRLEDEHNDMKAKRSKNKKIGVKRKNPKYKGLCL